MSILEQLQGYTFQKQVSERSNTVSSVFGSGEQGVFLEKVHNSGFAMVKTYYINGDKQITYDEYVKLSELEKKNYKEQLEYTELYKLLTNVGDQLVLANAGSGKTTALIFKILYDLVSGETLKEVTLKNGNTVKVADTIFVGTFLNTGALELKDRLVKWQRALGYSLATDSIQFSTLHAEFKRALNSMGVSTKIGSALEVKRCLDKAINNLGVTRDGYPLSAEDYNVIGSIISYYRGRLDKERYNHPNSREYGLTPEILDRLVKDFAYQRSSLGIMDFEDMQELLYKYLYVTPNKSVQEFCANRYKYIYLDEFQDTSQLQYAIIKFYARGRLWQNKSGVCKEDEKELYTGEEKVGKIIVVGDSDQCVTEDSKVWVEGILGEEEKLLRDVTEFDNVLSLNYSFLNKVKNEFVDVDKVFRVNYDGEIIKITTNNGKELKCTGNHPLFVRVDKEYMNQEDICYADILNCTLKIKTNNENVAEKLREIMSVSDNVNEFMFKSSNLERLKDLIKFLRLYLDVNTIPLVVCTYVEVKGEFFVKREMQDILVGDSLLNKDFEKEIIVSKEKEYYQGYVVDISVPSCRNFYVNNLLSHNCIYEWRGSDSNIIEELFEKDFRPTNASLTYNYRCPSNILKGIVPSIKLNSNHERREYHSSKDGGVLKASRFISVSDMIKELEVCLKKEMQENNSVAILCRTNFDGLIPALILEETKSFNFSISGTNMTLDSALPKKLLGMTSLFTDKNSATLRTALGMLVNTRSGGSYQVTNLINTLRNNNKSIWTIDENDLYYSCKALAPIIKNLKLLFYKDGKRVQEKEIIALIALYRYMSHSIFNGTSIYHINARAYIDVLIYILENNTFGAVFEFVDYVTYLNERLHARIENKKADICIATVHEFKGKERDTVIIWNDSKGVFPNSKTNLRDIKEVESERRVHYVACTRAKKKNFIYTLYNAESIYLKEMDIEYEQPKLQHSLKKDVSELTEEQKNIISVVKALE